VAETGGDVLVTARTEVDLCGLEGLNDPQLGRRVCKRILHELKATLVAIPRDKRPTAPSRPPPVTGAADTAPM